MMWPNFSLFFPVSPKHSAQWQRSNNTPKTTKLTIKALPLVPFETAQYPVPYSFCCVSVQTPSNNAVREKTKQRDANDKHAARLKTDGNLLLCWMCNAACCDILLAHFHSHTRNADLRATTFWSTNIVFPLLLCPAGTLSSSHTFCQWDDKKKTTPQDETDRRKKT